MSLRKLIFPSGTVHPLYAQYVGWSCISNALISVETAVATHNMLDAMSSGSDTLRTVNYIGKDVIGQLGGLWFMSKMSYKADKYPKRFLLYSNLIQQMAYMGICATPLAPDYFLPIGLGLTTLGADNGLFHLAVVSITGSLRIYSFNRATRGLL
jgi:predicted membrane-bound spermidine synthase